MDWLFKAHSKGHLGAAKSKNCTEQILSSSCSDFPPLGAALEVRSTFQGALKEIPKHVSDNLGDCIPVTVSPIRPNYCLLKASTWPRE